MLQRRVQAVLLVGLAVGLPILIVTGNLPSDRLVERILFIVALGLVGVIALSALAVCAFQGVQSSLVQCGHRRIVRDSFFQSQKEALQEALLTREEDHERHAAAILCVSWFLALPLCLFSSHPCIFVLLPPSMDG